MNELSKQIVLGRTDKELIEIISGYTKDMLINNQEVLKEARSGQHSSRFIYIKRGVLLGGLFQE
jgi:hypothetical protein